MEFNGEDPRGTQKPAIPPPHPLPYVSKKELARIKLSSPIPTMCPYCGGSVILTVNAEVYGKNYGTWPYIYLCKVCEAFTSLHHLTDLPYGTLADKATRELRKKVAELFDTYHILTSSKRKDVIFVLSVALNIPEDHCKWRWFDEDTCKKAINLLSRSIGRLNHEKRI